MYEKHADQCNECEEYFCPFFQHDGDHSGKNAIEACPCICLLREEAAEEVEKAVLRCEEIAKMVVDAEKERSKALEILAELSV